MNVSLYTGDHEWWLDEAISVTVGIPTDIKGPRGLTFLASGQSGRVTGVCWATADGWATTFERRVRFDSPRRLDPVPLDALASEVKGNALRNILDALNDSVGRFARVAGQHVLDVISTASPENAEAIDQTLASQNRFPEWLAGVDAATRETYRTERDAVLGALFIAGFDRNVLEEIPQPDVPEHYLARALEDQMLEADSNVFADWVREKGLSVGGAKFTSSDGKRRLTILNTNRTSIEHTVGVDMLIYVEEFQAFTLIQYKRIPDKGVFYPSEKQLQDELGRMRTLESKTANATPSMTLNDHRLSKEFLFFKFCSTKQPLEATELTRGMYIGLSWWDKTVNHPSTKGPNGGVQISFDTVPRYLTNTEFAQLVGNGWIGSNSAEVRSYLEAQVAAAYQNDHAVFLASLGLGSDRRPPRNDVAEYE